MSESGEDPALIGRNIAGKFLIEAFLGGGAMGAVYRARHTLLEKDVAIKVMHPSVAIDASFVARFHREAKAASRLDHPNSIRVIDFGEEPDGLLYIAMEYVSGRDLYKVINEDWPISNARIVELLSQALAAIAVAHDMGVIHRDLKPENIMIVAGKNDEGRPADVVKVCDFGIAKITDRDDDPKGPSTGPARKVTTQGLVVGTPDYMSPEQARGEKLDARSDLYSMGIILYQLLSGETPFAADTALAIVLKHITDMPKPPSEKFSGVHAGLEAVCLKALQKSPNDRFQDAREMRVALRSALEGRPTPSQRDLEPTMEMPAGGPPKVTPLAILHPAPTVAGAAVSVPSGTLAEELRPARGSAPLFGGIAVVAVALGVGGVFYANRAPKTLAQERTEKVEPAPTQIVTTPTEMRPVKTAEPSPTNPDKAHERPKTTPREREKEREREREKEREPEPTNVVAAAVDPPKPVDPPVVPPPVPIETAKPEPPKPTFNAQTCKASVGRPTTNGSTSAKDLRGDPANAINACAKQMTEKANVNATVTVHFNTSGNYTGTTCAGCPNSAVASCIAGRNPGLSLAIRGGDITGEPEYTYGVAFSCD